MWSYDYNVSQLQKAKRTLENGVQNFKDTKNCLSINGPPNAQYKRLANE